MTAIIFAEFILCLEIVLGFFAYISPSCPLILIVRPGLFRGTRHRLVSRNVPLEGVIFILLFLILSVDAPRGLEGIECLAGDFLKSISSGDPSTWSSCMSQPVCCPAELSKPHNHSRIPGPCWLHDPMVGDIDLTSSSGANHVRSGLEALIIQVGPPISS